MHLSSLFLFAVCLLVSFLYAGIEAGLLSLNRQRLRSRVHQGDRAAVRLNRLLAHPGRLLATVLLVTNFADVAALVLITNALFWRYGGRGCLLAGALMLPVCTCWACSSCPSRSSAAFPTGRWPRWRGCWK